MFSPQHNLVCFVIWCVHALCNYPTLATHPFTHGSLKDTHLNAIRSTRNSYIGPPFSMQVECIQHAAVHVRRQREFFLVFVPSSATSWSTSADMREFVVMGRVSACRGETRQPRILFFPFPSVIQLKWVFLTAHSVKLGGEFRLVLSRWLHPRLDYSLGFKPGPILRDAVWHFSLAYERLPYIGPALLSLCLPLQWPPTEQ